jgi:hypothetical protein
MKQRLACDTIVEMKRADWHRSRIVRTEIWRDVVMWREIPFGITSLLIALCLLGGCMELGEAPAPMLDETSMVVLRRETTRVLEDVQKARHQLGRSQEDVNAVLDRAEKDLQRLSGYYLPLLEVCQRADKALRLLHSGERDGATKELEVIEAELMAMGKSEDDLELDELEKPLEHVVDARLAISGESEDATEKLGTLINQLRAMLVKGGLMFR